MLVAGSFTSSSGAYTALFDGVAVPATWIQPGVLRCFCPCKDRCHSISILKLENVAKQLTPFFTLQFTSRGKCGCKSPVTGSW